MASFHVRSKACIAPIHVRSKVRKFALYMDGSNADFAPHIEESHADFALHLEQRHSFRDQRIAKIASFEKNLKELFKTTNILYVYMTNVTTFENKTMLREKTFND